MASTPNIHCIDLSLEQLEQVAGGGVAQPNSGEPLTVDGGDLSITRRTKDWEPGPVLGS